MYLLIYGFCLIEGGDLLLLLFPQLLPVRMARHRRRVMYRRGAHRTFHSAKKVTNMIDKTVSVTDTTPCVASRRRDSCVRS